MYGMLLSNGLRNGGILVMGERIVVVEDDKDIQYLLKNTLSRAGYDVEVLPDGDSLMKRKAKADLYLLDVNLPGISGLELCRLLKRNASTKDTPVIIVSAYPELKNDAPKYSADDSLEKPFNFTHLVHLISKHIRKSKKSEIN